MDVKEDTAKRGEMFHEKIGEVLCGVENLGYIDLVIGIPFYNEKESIKHVLKIVEEGLKAFPDMTKLIVCVGDPEGKETLEVIKNVDIQVPNISFIMDSGINGRGFSIMAIMEIAKRLEADAIILKADLMTENEQGFKPSWIEELVYPLTEGCDAVFASFKRHYFENTTGNLFVRPILETMYGYSLNDPLAGIYGFAHDLLEDYCMEAAHWYSYIGGYGIDPWLVTRAIIWNKRICEVSLGATLAPQSMIKVTYLFKEIARSLFECIINDQDYWLTQRNILEYPSRLLLHSLESKDMPKEVFYKLTDFIQAFKSGYEKYEIIYQAALPKESASLAYEIYNLNYENFEFDELVWSRFVYQFLQAYCFNKKVSKEDVLAALTVIYEGRIAGYTKQVRKFRDCFTNIEGLDVDDLVYKKAVDFNMAQIEALLSLKNGFVETWIKKSTETEPPITPLDYIEFIPGVPVVLPKQLKNLNGEIVWTNGIFNEIRKKYHHNFNNYIYNSLKIPKSCLSSDIVDGVSKFMQRLEDILGSLFPGDLYSDRGVLETVNKMIELMPCGKVLVVKAEVLKKLLYEFAPLNLLISLGYANVTELLNDMSPRKALTLASIAEERIYMDRINLWLKDNLRPDNMEKVDIETIIVSKDMLPNLSGMKNISSLNKITGTILISSLSKGMGGKYPKLLYFTHIMKNIIEAEHYAYIWEAYAKERRNFGIKVINSIVGHHGRDIFSAHNIFENWHQREFVLRLKKLVKELELQGLNAEAEAISLMAEGYGLSLTLEDGTFVPCSAWSWASYSFKGGEGVPTPLSLHVERNWFNTELLEEICRQMGYKPGEIMERVFQLMGEGKESYDLANILLKVKPYSDAVIVQDIENWPPAGNLLRCEHNPILKPIPEHQWESKYVLNAAAIRIEGRVYILYRAFGDDNISRIGMAISDGYNILERLPEPIFYPKTDEERNGCEDPRTVIIGDEIYMLYTAYDGVVAQIAAASIGIEDFLKRDFNKWKRLGLAFPNVWNKDAILFPEKINGQYVLYHRIEPSIWASYSNELKFPWSRNGHKIIIGPRAGMMWDSLKIGAGSQPIKTDYGWLLIYHGVDDNLVYRLGVILVDLNDPSRLLYRSPNPILSPQMSYEVGNNSSTWVPNVVFTCGAVPTEDKDILEADDEILVYYGAADTYLCVAYAAVKDLIPDEIRRRI